MSEIKVYSDPVKLNNIIKQWEELVRQTTASPFQSPSWLIPWYKYFGFGEPRVFTLWDEEHLQFIAPMFIRNINKGGKRKLVFIGTGNTDYLDSIYDKVRNNYFDSLFTYIGDIKEQWDECDLSDIPASSPLIHYMNATKHSVCPLLEVTEDYLSVFSKKRLQNIFRLEKRLNDDGELIYELPIIKGATHHKRSVGMEQLLPNLNTSVRKNHPQTSMNSDISSLLIEFGELHKKKWESESIFFDKASKSFLSECFPLMFGAGYAKSFMLCQDSKVIAQDLTFLKQDRLYDYLSAYDPDYEKYSPGLLLKIKMIEWCLHHKVRYFDFLKGKEKYKYSYGAEDTSTFRINIKHS